LWSGISPFAGIILIRLTGVISAFKQIFKSTPEIQAVKRTIEAQRYTPLKLISKLCNKPPQPGVSILNKHNYEKINFIYLHST